MPKTSTSGTLVTGALLLLFTGVEVNYGLGFACIATGVVMLCVSWFAWAYEDDAPTPEDLKREIADCNPPRTIKTLHEDADRFDFLTKILDNGYTMTISIRSGYVGIDFRHSNSSLDANATDQNIRTAIDRAGTFILVNKEGRNK